MPAHGADSGRAPPGADTAAAAFRRYRAELHRRRCGRAPPGAVTAPATAAGPDSDRAPPGAVTAPRWRRPRPRRRPAR